MEEIMKALENIQKELNAQKIEIQKNGERVTEQITHNITNKLEEKFTILEGKHQILNEKVEQQEKRIQFMEKQARQRNIIFFGIEEDETSYHSLENNILHFINEKLSLKLNCRDIQETKRLGKKGDKPRPIKVTFSTLGLKVSILKQKRLLKDTQYYLNEDYPKYILEKRKELQEEANKEREKGNKVTIKYDKLIVLKSNNKRSLANSPESDPKSQGLVGNNTRATKKNKINQSNPSLPRSNSVSEGILKPSILSYLAKNNANKQINDKTASSLHS
ncbi:uncharacterized protein LOC123690462 [Pieris rapae]|uniref:uncharacterized protein LOC123689751 n=1 Tax=Pieris rapae TaxID=64459 RepID=UPI001E27D236|nr:uncharacterized protein LOC123689751 [Pieris rapae]XP_045489847.1 uncharacterized protein LOC123690462 [Pieris rapae]